MSVPYIPASFSGSLPTATGLTNELDKIAQAFDECLSTSSTNAQQMEGDLDMNGHSILNAADLIVTDTGTSLASLENALAQEVLDRANEDSAEAAVRLAADTALQDQINLLGNGITNHGALTGLVDDDHPQYHNDARGDARYYTQAQVDTALAAESNTRATGLSTEATNRNNGDQNLQDQIDTLVAGGGGVTDHGALSGLGDDDHSQYHTDARGDVRYYLKAEVDNLLVTKLEQTRPAGWVSGNVQTEVEWDSGNAKYILHTRDGAVDLNKNPGDVDAITNWVLPHGMFLHDPLAAHLFAEGTIVTIIGSSDMWRVLGTATVAEKQASPVSSAGYTQMN